MSSATIINFPDLRYETLIPINAVPDRIPGEKCNPSTVQRWMRRGVSGITLETFTVGSKRYTSVEALDRFLIRVNGCDPDAQPTESVRPTMSRSELEAKRRKFNLPPAGKNGVAAGHDKEPRT